jgi:hypothetical protein
MLHGGEGTLSVNTPDLLQDRFEADAVFVSGLYLDDAVRECSGDLTQERAQSRLEGCLRHGVRLHMARAWLGEACAHAL